MSDRFYQQQNEHFNRPRDTKRMPKQRKLKKDVIKDLQLLLGKEIKGLDKLTIATLNELIATIEERNV